MPTHMNYEARGCKLFATSRQHHRTNLNHRAELFDEQATPRSAVGKLNLDALCPANAISTSVTKRPPSLRS